MKVVPSKQNKMWFNKIKGGNMEHTISILFYVRKSKSKDQNVAPVYRRITVNGGRIDQTTNRMIDITKWSADAGRLKGNTPDAKSFNSFLDALKNKVYACEKKQKHLHVFPCYP